MKQITEKEFSDDTMSFVTELDESSKALTTHMTGGLSGIGKNGTLGNGALNMGVLGGNVGASHMLGGAPNDMSEHNNPRLKE